MGCSGCYLFGSRQVVYEGNKNASVVILGESPGQTEIMQNRPFVGRAGKELDIGLEKAEIIRADCFIANSARCMISRDTKKSQKAIKNILEHCRCNVDIVMKTIKPKAVIVLGDIALRQLTKLRGITKHHGTIFWNEEYSCWVCPTYHPSYVMQYKQWEPLFFKDLIKFKTFFDNGFQIKDEMGLDFKEYDSIREIFTSDQVAVALDTETQGLNWLDPNNLLLSYSFCFINSNLYNPIFSMGQVLFYEQCDDKPLFYVDVIRKVGKKKEKASQGVISSSYFKAKLDELRWLLESPIKKYLMNGNFDLHFFGALFRRAGEILPKVNNYIMDVQAAAHIIDETVYNRNSLESLRRSFTNFTSNYDEEFKSKIQKDDMLQACYDYREEFTKYAISDAYTTALVAVELKKRLSEKKYSKQLNYFKRFTMPVLTEVLYLFEENGICLERDVLNNVRLDLESKRDLAYSEVIKHIPPMVVDQHKDKLKLTRAALLSDTLFSLEGFNLQPVKMTPGGKPSTDQETMTYLGSNKSLPKKCKAFFMNYEQWQKYHGLISKYLSQLEEAIQSDGRIHPRYSLVNAVTGRTSASGPSFQNMPRPTGEGAVIRKLLTAPEGWKLLCIDQSQSEVRWCAFISEDEGLRKVYQGDGDIHSATAEAILRKKKSEVDPKEFKEARQQAKAVTFGYLYGAMAKTFQRYAKIEYGLDISIERAEELRVSFFSKYPGVAKYHTDVKLYCHTYGYVDSPLGRRRHLPEVNSNDFSIYSSAERQAINFPIQSVSSDTVLLACHQLIKKGLLDYHHVRPIGFIHDELVFEIRDDPEIIKHYTKVICHEMENVPFQELFGFEMTIPLVAEAKMGLSLGEMVPYE
jgi:uracil-DNA glycosylase family 4